MKVIKGFEELLAAMQPEQLEGLLATMQQELEKKKQESKDKAFPFPQYEERLEKAQAEMGELLKAFIDEGAVAASIVMSCTAFDGKGTSVGLCIYNTLDDLNEDGLSAALDVFINPRRIAILKLLIPANMTASEISKKTGLVGGQLYHHLECLINANLIEKRGDTYRTKGDTQALLCGLSAAVGGMNIAKPI